jgi:thioredoxin 1
MAVIAVSDSDFEQKVLKSEKPVLVDFWAAWCTPCRLSEPVIEEMSSAYNGKVIFAKLNVDENIQTTQKYAILSIPTVILFKNGKEIGRHIGFAGKKPYEDLLNKI